jgi:hypothetical protein
MRLHQIERRAGLALLGCLLSLQALTFADSRGSERTPTLVELLRQNAYPLSEESGRLSGPGMEFLMKAAADVQFLAIGEEHNIKEIPQIASMLFGALHDRHGFNYLALEQDPLACQLASTPAVRGSLDATVELAKKYPNAFTFDSDQELTMIAHAGAMSKGNADAVWGLDQSFGALHTLVRLAELAPNPDVRERTQKLAEASRKYDTKRFRPGRHYMSDIEKADDFWRLAELYQPAPNPEARFLASQLVLSARVYQNYKRGNERKVPGAFESNREREENMKDLFLRNYRQAQGAGEAMPRVLFKFGHWHAYRGRYHAYIPTLGNFVGEFAKSNGMKSFHLAVHVNNPPGGFRGMRKDSWLQTLAEAAPPAQWTIVDVRSLRDYWYAKTIKMPDELREEIFGFDALLMIGGAKPATYRLTGRQQ